VAFTLYALGQTYYWPCVLGFTSERYPQGGALTLNTVSAIGLLTAGVVGTPILGDEKYGHGKAVLSGLTVKPNLHLHARSIRMPHPDGGVLTATAPLPSHMRDTWRFFEFGEDDGDPFADLDP